MYLERCNPNPRTMTKEISLPCMGGGVALVWMMCHDVPSPILSLYTMITNQWKGHHLNILRMYLRWECFSINSNKTQLVFLFSLGLAVTQSLWTRRGLCVHCAQGSLSCSLHLIHVAPHLSPHLWRKIMVRYARSWLARVTLRWWESSVQTLLARHTSARAELCVLLIELDNKSAAPGSGFPPLFSMQVIEITPNQHLYCSFIPQLKLFGHYVSNSSAFKDKVN